jgi:threonylcarbamoyladenosine tRNA methylthiotransferase MtaB
MLEIVTFGCRLNTYESEAIKENLSSNNPEEKIIVFNTCAVTKEAERQALQAIRKAAREKPDYKIIVTGCAAQINPEKFAALAEVTKVIGNEEKFQKKSYDLSNQEEKILVNDIMSVKETASHLVTNFEGKARAFVQVQNGCNHRCTFCTIPFGRGNSRSVAIGEIVKQVQILVDNGFKEVVLTGVDITDYGLDLPGKPSLGQMMRRLLTLVPSLSRLRLSSIDVAEIDDDLMNLIANEPRLMPHFHISLQAGDNMILKRMKRRHNREMVIDFCKKVRLVRPESSFGADIIAGFPTETEEMFENTRKLIAEADLVFLHVFPYSAREGTPASKMPQVPMAKRKERAKILRQEGEHQLKSFAHRYIGETVNAIIENDGNFKAENFLEIKAAEEYNLPAGQIVKVKINNNLLGEVIK